MARRLSSTELKSLLGCVLFQGVAEQDLTPLDLRPHRRTFKAGSIIFDREDKSREVYFLLEGRVLAVYFTKDGREIIFGRIGPGAHFGEMSALDDQDRSLSIYAHQDTEVLVLSQKEFLSILDNVATTRRHLMPDLATRIRLMNERNYQTTALSVDQRVRAYLVRLGLEVGALSKGGEILDAPTHLEIANSVGSNREAVSRVIADLKREGVIEGGRKRICFRRPDVLVEQTI